MEKGEQEESMRREIQDQVKLKARRRRHKAHLQRAIRDMDECELDATVQGHSSDADRSASTGVLEEHAQTDAASGQSGDFDGPSPPSLPNSDLITPADPISAISKELELGGIMAYLDYTLPTIFPMYNPSLLRGGRGWLLTRIMQNEALRHIIVGVSAHFLTVVPVIGSPDRMVCETWTLREFKTRVMQAIVRVRQDIGEPSNWQIAARGGGLIGKVRLLESVVHLMLLEIYRADTEQWELHLDAAAMLFRQIMNEKAASDLLSNEENAFQSVFLEIGATPVIDGIPLSDYTPWNADQATFYFSASVLAAADIISSISLHKRPRLQELHPMLLSEDDSTAQFGLQLQDVFGCSSRVFLILTDIAVLDEWKRDSKQSGIFSFTQVVRRGGMVEQKITESLADCMALLDGLSAEAIHDQSYFVQYLDGALGRRQPDTSKMNYIWLLAAQVYLHVVLSGWQPLAPTMRKVVSEAISLFQSTPTHRLHALAWPFCVVGCIAEPSQENTFRELHGSMGSTAKFGSMAVAMSVLNEFWHSRGSIDNNSLDLAACFAVLGHRIMLL
jgi:C6 transcription factor Pro1